MNSSDWIDIIGTPEKALNLEAIFGGKPFVKEEIVGDVYIFSEDSGIELIFDQNAIVATILLLKEEGEVSGFKGKLPLSLSFDMPQADVRSCLDSPLVAEFGEKSKDLAGDIYPWDLWEVGSIWINCSYSHPEMTLRRVTIMRDRVE